MKDKTCNQSTTSSTTHEKKNGLPKRVGYLIICQKLGLQG